uniref:DUF4587 domain-containing protein n=1 Tax=Strix occidentalis caurina TaxID=311401 RepID=A0A8D0FRA9_STROC
LASGNGDHLGAAPSQALIPWPTPYSLADLIKLMMLQNSQMHQVVMNSLAVSALTSFGFGPSPGPQNQREPKDQKDLSRAAQESGMTVSCFGTGALCHPVWGCMHISVASGVTGLPAQAGTQGAMPGWHLLLSLLLSSSAVPPPPPPSATGTVGANIPPASGKDMFSPCPSKGDILPSSMHQLDSPHSKAEPSPPPPPIGSWDDPCTSCMSPFPSTEYYDVVEERL